MYLPPQISSLNSRERQRDLLARADRHRLVRQLGSTWLPTSIPMTSPAC
jgi:hypothetical protein